MLFGIILLAGMGFCLLTCEKANDNDSDGSITGRYFDQELIGIWTMNYSARDVNNGITSWTDSIRLEENNFDTKRTYRFSELEQELEEFSLSQLKSADLLVFGATTYKGMADYRTPLLGRKGLQPGIGKRWLHG